MNTSKIIEEIIIVDGHSDIPRDIYLKELKGKRNVFFNDHYPELQKGGVNILFANIFTKGTKEDSLIQGLLEVEKILKITEECEDVVLVKNKEDLDHVLKAKKLGMVLSLEGLEPLYDNLELLDMYYRFGVRVGMLTWNKKNSFAHGTDEETGGANPFR